MEHLRALVGDDEYESAFTLVKHLVSKVSTPEIDDSDGTTGWIMGELVSILTWILDDGPDLVSNTVFDWLYPLLEGETLDYLANDLIGLLMNYFQEENQLQKKLKLINSNLDSYEERALRLGEPRRFRWLEYKLNTLWALGDEEQAEQLVLEHLDVPEIRLLVVERHLRVGEYNEAIHLLTEGKELFKDCWGIADQYSRKLIEIYQWRSDQHSLLSERRLRLLKYAPGSLGAYLEYKSMFSHEDWPAERDYILYRLREGWAKEYKNRWAMVEELELKSY